MVTGKGKKSQAKNEGPKLLIGTRKGAFFLQSDMSRRSWKMSKPMFPGHVIHHVVVDPRDNKTMLVAAGSKEPGATIFRSTNGGRAWKQVDRPPVFQSKRISLRLRVKSPDYSAGRNLTPSLLSHISTLAPGHLSEPEVWYAGSSPQGLFRSDDGGRSWKGVKGFNEHPKRFEWSATSHDGIPNIPRLHSILVDPLDPNHMYISMSTGGVFESLDQGKDWKPLNKGCATNSLPTGKTEYGHGPHNVQLHPLNSDRLYQQNDSGTYRMNRPEGQWIRIGGNIPKTVSDNGFSLLIDPQDPDSIWVFPMDDTRISTPTSPGGKPAIYVSRNAGHSWKRLEKGLPLSEAWFTVGPNAMCHDKRTPLGLYFGTTSGQIWASRDAGASWKRLAENLPSICSLEVLGVT